MLITLSIIRPIIETVQLPGRKPIAPANVPLFKVPKTNAAPQPRISFNTGQLQSDPSLARFVFEESNFEIPISKSDSRPVTTMSLVKMRVRRSELPPRQAPDVNEEYHFSLSKSMAPSVEYRFENARAIDDAVEYDLDIETDDELSDKTQPSYGRVTAPTANFTLNGLRSGSAKKRSRKSTDVIVLPSGTTIRAPGANLSFVNDANNVSVSYGKTKAPTIKYLPFVLPVVTPKPVPKNGPSPFPPVEVVSKDPVKNENVPLGKAPRGTTFPINSQNAPKAQFTAGTPVTHRPKLNGATQSNTLVAGPILLPKTTTTSVKTIAPQVVYPVANVKNTVPSPMVVGDTKGPTTGLFPASSDLSSAERENTLNQ